MNPTRLLAALLALSLAGNAAWLWRRAHADASHAAGATPTSASPTPVPLPANAAAAAPSPEAARALQEALAGGDLARFRDLLVAAGVGPKLRKQLLLAAVQHRFEARFDIFEPADPERLREQWWLNPYDHRGGYGGRVDLQRLEAMQQLHEEMNAEIARLTGEDPRAFDPEDNPWLARQFAGLPREKAEALHRIQSDYQELEQEIHMHAMGFELPEDEAKLRLLREERERDIAALLTPEERAEWELRASPTADRARNLATEFRASEDEYRRIYALQKAFDEKYDFERLQSEGREIDWQAHNDAQEELQKQIRALVGDDRYLAARRETQPDYQLARSAAERLGLPAETADHIVALRQPAAAESQRIADDPALGPDEKRAALARLAADTRAQVESTLGPAAAAAYFKRGGMRWLDDLAKGSRLVIRDENAESEFIDGVTPDGVAPPWGSPAPSEAPVLQID